MSASPSKTNELGFLNMGQAAIQTSLPRIEVQFYRELLECRVYRCISSASCWTISSRPCLIMHQLISQRTPQKTLDPMHVTRRQTGPEVLGGKTAKNTKKTRKTLRNCMASLLRGNIQDFVQEVPVGQMAQGTPCRGPPTPPHCEGAPYRSIL